MQGLINLYAKYIVRSTAQMRSLYVQAGVTIFTVLCLLFLQETGQANTPLYGMLLTLAGPGLSALITTQAVSSITNAVKNQNTTNGDN